MRHLLSAAIAGLALAGAVPGAASAQSSDSTTPPAVVTDHNDSHTTAAPVPGKNSFTEAQARERLEKHGYTAVSPLQKDANSIWRGTAMKDGRSVQVAVDYQGNIVGQ